MKILTIDNKAQNFLEKTNLKISSLRELIGRILVISFSYSEVQEIEVYCLVETVIYKGEMGKIPETLVIKLNYGELTWCDEDKNWEYLYPNGTDEGSEWISASVSLNF